MIIFWSTATVIVLIAFTVWLNRNSLVGLLGEIGFVYMLCLAVYTIGPGLCFLLMDWNNLRGITWLTVLNLNPDFASIGNHMARHMVYIAFFSLAYAFYYPKVSGKKLSSELQLDVLNGLNRKVVEIFIAISFVVVFLICCLLVFVSEPVLIYEDHYTRYSHLGLLQRKIISVIIRLKSGLTLCALPLMFVYYKRFKWSLWFLIFCLAVFEIYYSVGSRIEAYFLIVFSLVLYHLAVSKIQIKSVSLIGSLVVIGFSLLEGFRTANFDFEQFSNNIKDNSISPPAELCSVFSTGYHLYQESLGNQMPPVEWPMFFSDFINLVTPNDFTRFHPQHWYSRSFFPGEPFPSQTNGPISDSAIWGGEFDLVVRAVMNGWLFAKILGYFLKQIQFWWSYAIYGFCLSTSIMVIKYSVFYHLNPLIKTVIPAVIAVNLIVKKYGSTARNLKGCCCSAGE
jgi:hypothetical protein